MFGREAVLERAASLFLACSFSGRKPVAAIRCAQSLIARAELFPRRLHQIDLRYRTMSSIEKPAGLPSLVSRRTERTSPALQSRFLELVEKVRQTRPASDIELLRRSFEFAAEQHRTQLRQSGDPYLSH